ncbi:MAG: sigma-70 family RNA polymerase sigma factor [Lachnospiraceae bacterium]|nr:sigma-70 family RNA polymerase sigma factor [Lachnospiraceae bacterium]
MANFNHDYIGNLVMRAQADDSDAFAELYALTYKHIYNYAGHYLRDEYLAQDAMQETYVSALKNIRKIKEPSLFVAWLNQICFHVCFDMCKKSDANYDTTTSSELLEIIKDEHTYHDPVISYEDKEETLNLKKAVGELPFNEQQVIVMRYYNDMKLEEIASAMGVSRSSVKRYLISGREKLKKKLTAEVGS